MLKVLNITWHKEVNMLSIVDIAIGNFDTAINALKAIDAGEYSYDHVSSIHSNGARRKTDRLDDDMVREIRDARKSGRTLLQLSNEYCMDEAVISKLTMWSSYKDVDPHLKSEYLASYLANERISEKQVKLVVKLRSEGLSKRYISARTGIHQSTLDRMLAGKIGYLRKYYDDGTITIEYKGQKLYSYAGAIKARSKSTMSLEKIRRIRNHRYNGLPLREICKIENKSITTVYQITVWQAYWDVDPELKSSYMAKYKDKGKSNAA